MKIFVIFGNSGCLNCFLICDILKLGLLELLVRSSFANSANVRSQKPRNENFFSFFLGMTMTFYFWKSWCHIKRRVDMAMRACPSFGMTTQDIRDLFHLRGDAGQNVPPGGNSRHTTYTTPQKVVAGFLLLVLHSFPTF